MGNGDQYWLTFLKQLLQTLINFKGIDPITIFQEGKNAIDNLKRTNSFSLTS